ncbi:glycosyl transferase family 1 [Antricoccus suffuscus]|uniref:Glycosyl transferase family 1 n=1 Tax=Antricoccus suffuscus TaxID=1629062 RepID=A0A2T1A625_9ACTN|nr:glycosyltransferase [Antricoccus suffuscus]PRZ44014.1 glycosyl transferase family 1 [Antricoccus suffuscus]
MSPYRVLIIVSSLRIGGPQKSLVGLLERLDPRQFDVNLLVLDPGSDALAPWIPGHVTVLATPPALTSATIPATDAARHIARLFRIGGVRSSWKLLNQIVRGAAATGGRQQARQHVWRILRKRLPKIPGKFDMAIGVLGQSTYCAVDLVDAHFRYHWVRSDTRVLNRDVVLDGRYFGLIHGVVAVSTLCAKIFEDMYPVLRGCTQVYKNDIPNGPSMERAEVMVPLAAEGTVNLLTVSRLDPLKGLELAVAACDELVRAGRRIRWVVLGDGPSRAELEAEVRARGLQRYFLLPGSVSDTLPYVSAADIYVHPSRTEGRSNSVEEARAAGKPIVVTNYPTVADQVENGVTGVVCEIDIAAIGSAIGLLIDNPVFAEKLGHNASVRYAEEVDDPNALFAALCTGRIAASSGTDE